MGYHYCHAVINDILYNALLSAGLSRSDGKQPDMMTMVHGNMASL